MNNIIDGKSVSSDIRAQLGAECAELYRLNGKKPKLAIVLVGDNPASLIYVSSKERACAEIGIESLVVRLGASITQFELCSAIDELAQENEINGIMLQLPLPKGLNAKEAIERIPASKDVDGLTAVNAGMLFHSIDTLYPCTPKGIICLLKQYSVNLEGARAVIIGRSNLVGKPIALMLLNENCTVTVCHSKTKNIFDVTKEADIIVVAVGVPNFLKGDAIKEGAIVIDVGINRVDGKICGDVHFESVKRVASLITPVPGGVGPMTVAMLMDNTVQAFCAQNAIKRIK